MSNFSGHFHGAISAGSKKRNGTMPKNNFGSMVTQQELLGLDLALGSAYKPLPYNGKKGISSKDASPQCELLRLGLTTL